MKITFPHFGNAFIAFKAAAESIGLEAVVPPRPNKHSLELGIKNSPEFICLPFKLNMGNLMLALDSGADAITYAAGVGPCRFGYYGEGIGGILKEKGYKFEMFKLEQRNIFQVYRRLKTIYKGRFFFLYFLRGFIIFWQKAKLIDLAEKLKRKIKPLELKKGETERVFVECLSLIEESKTVRQNFKLRKEIKVRLGKVIKDRTRKPLKVGLVGEIYLLLEPYVNMDIEAYLNRLGCEVHNELSLYKWLKYIFRIDLFGKRTFRRLRKTAKPYLSANAGGESQNAIGSTIFYSKEGYDGVIHLYPFTCMPGLVAHTILEKVSKDHDIPVFNYSIDEHAGKEGFYTRLEAFVDLLKKKREERLAAA